MQLSYLHPIDAVGNTLPTAFTYPYRYTPHPLCILAAQQVQARLSERQPSEGKMYGVLVVRNDDKLAFLAAYSGQQQGGYDDDWFVPPVFDYLQPDGYFMQEQTAIVALNQQIASWHRRSERVELESEKRRLEAEREEAVARAKDEYKQTKGQRTIADSQYLKANIRRAKNLYADELATVAEALAEDNAALHQLQSHRKQRSESLQQWLFEQFVFMNACGVKACLTDLFPLGQIPSGAGECCAPKLLQTAYNLGLQPLCMAEFWWQPDDSASSDRISGCYYPACNRKCRPILDFMLQGLTLESDPAAYYNKVYGDVKPQVIWEDQWYAAVSKPAGWLSVQGLAQLPDIEDYARRHWSDASGPMVVHRLDQDTSGLLLIAKTADAHRRAQWLFEHRQVHKTYIAQLEHPVSHSSGVISLPLMPDLDNRPRQCVSHQYGLEAVTRYEVLAPYSADIGLRVAFYPETGRTHQLRVHAASPQGLNSPIRGDRLYGHLADRLYLHAATLTFQHPFTHETLLLECPCPF